MRRIWYVTAALFTLCFTESSRADEARAPLFGTLPDQCRCNQLSRAPVKIPSTYPVCFYDVELGAVSSAKASWTTQTDRLAAALASIVGNKKQVTVVSSRNIVVLAPKYRHRRIRGIWPEIACIGQSGGETSANRRKICVSYIREVLKAFDTKTSPPADVPEPICQTFLD